MESLQAIKKTHEYLYYIEEHILNVQKAWKELQEKCEDLLVLETWHERIDNDVKNHDLSKLSEDEFVQYRKVFYPTEKEKNIENSISEAWNHHKDHNPHHWETWTMHSAYWETNCIHMVIDWMAMSYKFGDTAKEYYEKNKDKIKLPDHAVKLIYVIFDKLEY